MCNTSLITYIIVHVVLLNDHLDQFVAQHEGKNDPRDGDNHRFGKVFDHGKDTGIKEQQMSRGEMIFSQKRREYWLLSCSLGEVAGYRGRVAPCKAYAYRHSSEASFAVK